MDEIIRIAVCGRRQHLGGEDIQAFDDWIFISDETQGLLIFKLE